LDLQHLNQIKKIELFEDMQQRDTLIGVFSVIYRWRKAIRNMCVIVALGTAGLSLLMDNYYKSTTIFYPASPELANPELIFGYTAQVTNYFGSDRDLDRLAEIANSSEVVDYMVRKFDLYRHYDIDSTEKKGQFKVREQFRRLYSALKNKNDAIELSVEDTDPRLATLMANSAREHINSIGERLIKNSQARLMATFEENMRNKEEELILFADSLRFLQQKYNIFSSGIQGDQMAKSLTDAESKIIRARARLEVLEKNPIIPRDTIEYIRADLLAYERERISLMTPNPKGDNLSLKTFNEGLPKLSVIADMHNQGRKQLSYDRERYNQIKAAYRTSIPSIQLVEAAEEPLLKSRPKRSIIVIGAVLAAFLFTVLAALIAEAYRDVKWREITG
jgi:tyrosine-protein kinase Etk/Wzc